MRISLPSGTPGELFKVDGASLGVVVIPDIMGLRDLFDDHVRELAERTGWTVCAFEVWAGQESLSLPERLKAVNTLEDSRVLGDAAAAAEATGCETVGILGFCMGGMYALKAAGTGHFHRAVSFYGMVRVPEDWRGAGHAEPLHAVGSTDACPVLALVGSEDPWIPEADASALEGTGATVVRYPDRDHGFVHDPDRDAHHAVDADDAWDRALAFLAE